MPIPKNTQAQQPEPSDKGERSQSKVKPTYPNWQAWKTNRPICTLRDGLLLAHNVATNSETLAKLKKNDDDRVGKFNTHRKTAITSIKMGHHLLRYEGALPRQISNVELFLPDFVAWVEEMK